MIILHLLGGTKFKLIITMYNFDNLKQKKLYTPSKYNIVLDEIVNVFSKGFFFRFASSEKMMYKQNMKS